MTVITTTKNMVPSLGNFVGGKDLESERWVYALSMRAVLDDSFASLTLKRNLESGELPETAASPDVVVGRVALADDEVIEAALKSAAEAAAVWRSASLEVRLDKWMSLLHAVVTERRDDFIRMLVVEGHPLELARWEWTGLHEMTRKESSEFMRSQLWFEQSLDGRRNIVRRQPDGVVCVNPPANAPLVSALLSVMSIAAGNAVVVRAPRSVPYSVMYVLRNIIAPTLEEVGAPPGILNVVCADPQPVLDAWIASPYVNDIMYFGDVPSGLKIERRCVEAGKKPILELAGNDIVLVWSDADLDAAAEALTESFYGSGQLCMIPNQAIVHPAVADDLIALIVEKASKLRPGYPDEEGVLLSPVLRHDKFHKCLANAVDMGATVVMGGSGMQLDGARDPAGFFLEPTLIRVEGMSRARELDAVLHETFFPLLPVIVPEFTDNDRLLDECLTFVNSNLYGLRNSLWANDPAVIDRFIADVSNGGLLKVNDSHIAFASPLPSHGGTGLTGGAFGEANYPILRTTHIQGVSVVQPKQSTAEGE